ncbi:MAG: hypothetical protein IJA36_06020 [Lachnospiraceae bacterium]|nr:hypothetical protein [Lachnospiraceae bacterium]
MMTYDEFKEKIKEGLQENFPDMDVEIHPAQKVNRTIDEVILKGVKIPTGMNISPAIPIANAYEAYQHGELLENIIESFTMQLKEYLEPTKQMLQDFSFEKEQIKKSIVFQVIQTKQNQELLADVPNRTYHDLSIIYRFVVEAGQDGISSAIIKKDFAERYDFTEPELFELAKENTRRILPPKVISMREILLEVAPPDIWEEILNEISPEQTMYVITNGSKVNGAVSILYEDVLQELSEKLQSDLYILPSSIHEMIAVSCKMGSPNELAAMVQEINVQEVALEERLSNNVYHFDRTSGTLSLATDYSDIRLDGLKEDEKVKTAPMEDIAKRLPNPGRSR